MRMSYRHCAMSSGETSRSCIRLQSYLSVGPSQVGSFSHSVHASISIIRLILFEKTSGKDYQATKKRSKCCCFEATSTRQYSYRATCMVFRLPSKDIQMLTQTTFGLVDPYGSNQKVLVNLVRAFAAILECSQVQQEAFVQAFDLFINNLDSVTFTRSQGTAAAHLSCVDAQWSRISNDTQVSVQTLVVDLMSRASFQLLSLILAPSNKLDFLAGGNVPGSLIVFKEAESKLEQEKERLPFQQAQKLPQMLEKLRKLQETTTG